MKLFFPPRGLIVILKDVQFHSYMGILLEWLFFVDGSVDMNHSMLQGVSPAEGEKDFMIWLIVTVGVVLMFLGKQTIKNPKIFIIARVFKQFSG